MNLPSPQPSPLQGEGERGTPAPQGGQITGGTPVPPDPSLQPGTGEIPPGPPLTKGGDEGGGATLPEWARQTALARAALVRLYREAVRRAGRGQQGPAKQDFARTYNLGAWPELYARLGQTSWQSLERWSRTLAASGDPWELAPAWGEHRRAAWQWDKKAAALPVLRGGLSAEQQKILLGLALHPNRLPVSQVLCEARKLMAARGVANGHADRTYRRFLEAFRQRYYDLWTFYRRGEKALHDEALPYLVRDYDQLQVGDCLVADGHVCNFQALNPWTGKPGRMTLLLFYDMKSSFPAGWEVMPTENTGAIAAALRRAILRLGKAPKCVYLDNGKAFGARFFSGNLAEAGFQGLFGRLGIETIFAWPYHAQSKTVERFFKELGNFERRLPSYTGTSIARKPPRLNRGERVHRQLHEKIGAASWVPTLEELHRALAEYFDEYAGKVQKRGHLAGQCPREVFEAGRGPGVDEAGLRELMLSIEVRTIHRNGISWLGQDFYHPELYGRRHRVLVRYDLQDRGAIYVYEETGKLICAATPVPRVHPIAKVTGTAADRELVAQQIEQKQGLLRETTRAARAFAAAVVIPETRRLLATQGLGGEEVQGSRFEVQGSRFKVQGLGPGEAERIQRESAGIQVAGGDAGAAGQVLELPPAVGETELLCAGLERLPDPDRYERLLELEAQGHRLPRRELAWCRYFEETEVYARQADYYEERRAMLLVCYQRG